jgi:hypothetical protein
VPATLGPTGASVAAWPSKTSTRTSLRWMDRYSRLTVRIE